MNATSSAGGGPRIVASSPAATSAAGSLALSPCERYCGAHAELRLQQLERPGIAAAARPLGERDARRVLDYPEDRRTEGSL